jgi:hypothetical protein
VLGQSLVAYALAVLPAAFSSVALLLQPTIAAALAWAILGELDRIEVLDSKSGRIRLGSGARWGHVPRALAPHGLAMSSGNYGDVGVSGLATEGGIGFLARKHGLTIDHVAAAELVFADGTFVRADSDHHPDRFWAVRGAGANFGIVISLELDAYRQREVVFSDMVFDGGDIAPLLQRWEELVESASRELTSFLYAFAQRGATPTVRLSNVYAGDDTEVAVDALAPLVEIGRLLGQQASLAPYAAIVPPLDNEHYGGQRRPLISNGLANRLTPERELLALGLHTRVTPWISIRSVGGAVNELDAADTAYAHRHQNFNVSSVGHDSAAGEFARHWDELRPHLDGLYTSFETDERPKRLHDAFPSDTKLRMAFRGGRRGLLRVQRPCAAIWQARRRPTEHDGAPRGPPAPERAAGLQ